jgi:hypothetical protein
MRTSFALFFMGTALAFAADTKPPATAPPPEVDQALRDRVTKFYQAHVDGKYRQAEQYIAEDSKDLYYASQKPHYLSFAIQRIEYAENFTQATVFTKCELEMRHPIAGTMTFNVLSDSSWKLENGQWCWYIDPNLVRGAFGETKHVAPGSWPPPTTPATKPAGGIVAQHANPEKLLEAVAGAVRADRTEVRLDRPGASAEVTLTNTLAGPMKLKLQLPTDPSGFEARLERESLPGKGTAKVLFRAKKSPVPREAAVVSVAVETTGQTIPLRVVFGPVKK